MGEPTTPVQLPSELHRRIRARMRGSAFPSVDDFVAFVLTRLLEGDAAAGEPISPEDEARVRQRLRALGYID